MTPDEYERNKSLAMHLEHQHPDNWIPGTWYLATLPNGKQAEILKANGKGKQAGKRYLHVKLPTTIVVKTPAGHVIDSKPGFDYFRINMQTYDIACTGYAYA